MKTKTKTKTKTKSRVVRGPQRKLPLTTKAAPDEQGNPLVAFRCPAVIVNAYIAKHGDRAKAWASIRRHMKAAS